MTRFLLVLAVIAFFVLCVAAMYWGWRNRRRRQSYLPAFPEAPENLAFRDLPELTGVYVSTVTAGNWQDRIAIGDIGFRSEVTVRLAETGLLFDRVGANPLWIPVESIVDIRRDRGIAGKVMGIEGLLVVRWKLGEHQFDSGVRGDDKDVYEAWIGAVRALAGVTTGDVA